MFLVRFNLGKELREGQEDYKPANRIKQDNFLKHIINSTAKEHHLITQQQREAAKRRIHNQGKTLNQWAQENGFRPIEVYRLLDGTLKGRNGTSHNVAVALGIKQAV